LGALYSNGWGVSRDPRAAVSWFERAARQGNDVSEQALRDLLAQGVGEAAAALHRLGLSP